MLTRHTIYRVERREKEETGSYQETTSTQAPRPKKLLRNSDGRSQRSFYRLHIDPVRSPSLGRPFLCEPGGRPPVKFESDGAAAAPSSSAAPRGSTTPRTTSSPGSAPPWPVVGLQLGHGLLGRRGLRHRAVFLQVSTEQGQDQPVLRNINSVFFLRIRRSQWLLL